MGEHISFVVNGTRRELDVEPRRLLVQALRDDLDLTGTHIGCDTSQCGACTVHVDGKAVYSCMTYALSVQGRAVTTVEALSTNGRLDPLQQASVGCHQVGQESEHEQQEANGDAQRRQHDRLDMTSTET